MRFPGRRNELPEWFIVTWTDYLMYNNDATIKILQPKYLSCGWGRGVWTPVGL